MITREQAEKFREIITAHAEDFSDEEAVQAPHLFPGWNGGGTTYAVGDRIQYGGKPYKCLQEHTSQVTWTPEDAPSLWALILIPDPEVIPDWVQPDSTNAYMTGDKVACDICEHGILGLRAGCHFEAHGQTERRACGTSRAVT